MEKGELFVRIGVHICYVWLQVSFPANLMIYLSERCGFKAEWNHYIGVDSKCKQQFFGSLLNERTEI